MKKKSEAEEVKRQFRQQAEDLKTKHAEEHPDYHYSPRKPSERKRRASSRQDRKTSLSAKSPKSPMSTNEVSDVSTPGYTEPLCMPVDDGLAGIDIPMPEQPFEFDHMAFDTLLEQMRQDSGRDNLFPENLNFSEYMTEYP
ncbi:uncharacterized protein LDX57_006659 [Aspergillus melleus]|uniref:uncharacterized protein n=1 Tax=Aspergillus melleus TaxID=138277 RepID=UPI001E8DE128|nr:uncharacterized protein LDX57_006659 [Aspergillus melleus]KAH8428988.1 hypothetical protein LDX57_006659 [Aspergillus melleus]